MRKFLLIYAMGATLLLIAGVALLRHSHREVVRLRNNNEALTSETRLYKSRCDASAASVVALQLKLDEFRQQHKSDVKRIKSLRLRLRHVESVATAASQSVVEVATPRRDTILYEQLLPDTVTLFEWSDRWVRVEGVIGGDSVSCRVESVDTLYQVIHRVPRRFLFFRYGTKAIRQEITSSNPHTRITYAEYIELPKRRGRR